MVEESNRLRELIDGVWEEIFSTPSFRAYLKLLTASQYDTALAGARQDISLQR